ncbi:hypothetical protein EB796_013159 [Bugula neritina]|uniref:Uncharacterized protein n=1 Tax=Bugula neritina TaxID=10212 RepID=A0A7J7JRL7_BUGNE|nr:hypothetical protein EB796_013159 [Bugula neritina]
MLDTQRGKYYKLHHVLNLGIILSTDLGFPLYPSKPGNSKVFYGEEESSRLQPNFCFSLNLHLHRVSSLFSLYL